MSSPPTALVCDVQRFSVHDGPGIRTTVFFKGCPLACRWCQNPEAIAFGNQLMYARADCIGCGDCARACPRSAISLAAGRPVLDRSVCQLCLACVQACPAGALSAAARALTPAALLAEVMRDTDYYPPDGGVTLSGGEPLAQRAFLADFLPSARAAGLHVVAQTAGYFDPGVLQGVIAQVDLFLFDLKLVDPDRHRALTGRSNRLILANLAALVAAGRKVQVRMPIVPGYNDDEGNLDQTTELIRALGLGTITLLAYHDLGEAKRAKLLASSEPFSVGRDGAGALASAAAAFAAMGLEVRSADPA